MIKIKKIDFSKINLKNILIISATIAFILGATATFVVFYNPNVSINVKNAPSNSLFAIMKNSTGTTNQNTTSSNNQSANTTNNSTTATIDQNVFSSSYSSPFPLQWQEGQSTLVITGASLNQNKLQFSISVQMGDQSECIPLNIKFIIDESGNTENPTEKQFTFPDTNSCNGTPNATYNEQTVSFDIPQNASAPFLFSTGGSSNIFFEVATTTGNGISITLPTTTD